MRRGTGVVLAAALCVPATAEAQDLELSRVTRGPGTGQSERYTEMKLASADGTRAVFESEEDILGEGFDPGFNFYARVGETTARMANFGGTGGHSFSPLYRTSADASRIVFRSYGHWTADDTDDQQDVFTAAGGVVERVSQGPLGGNHPDFGAEAVGLSGDGARVLFESAENLTADDTDFRRMDIFMREGGATTRVSTGPNGGNGTWDAVLRGQSADASVLVIGTGERLTPDDTDDQYDLFVRSGGATTKLTPGNGPHNVGEWPDGVTPDGRTIVFNTPERLTADDTDDRSDVYRVSGGTITRVSTGPLGGNSNGFAVGDDPDSGIPRGDVVRVSDDGRRIVFYTDEKLTGDDDNTWTDAYVWSPAGVERVPGHPTGASADGSTVVTRSWLRLTADDTDDYDDLFASRDGVLRRITTGPAGGNGPNGMPCWSSAPHCGGFRHISEDGSRILFVTMEKLVAADVDDQYDLYQWAGGVTTLLSPGGATQEEASFVDAALDGSIVYFETEEPLTVDDSNTRLDAYRVSAPPAGEITPVPGGTAGPAGSASQAGARLRLRGRPRAIRLVRGRTRLARSGRGLPFSLTQRAVLRVTLRRLGGGRTVVLRLQASAGRHVLRLGRRLPGARRLHPGRYRITLEAANTARLTVRLSGP
jgi:hypothetical protein